MIPINAYWADSKNPITGEYNKIPKIDKTATDTKKIFLVVENIPDELGAIRFDIYEKDLIWNKVFL